MSADWGGTDLSLAQPSPVFFFVMIVGAAEERNLVEDVLLEPFEPEINHGRNKQRDHL